MFAANAATQRNPQLKRKWIVIIHPAPHKPS